MTRRNFLAHLLDTVTGRPAPSGISPRMADLIAAFKSHEAAAAEIDFDTNPVGAEIAYEMEIEALTRLLNHRPATIAEFSAKFSAVIPATSNDTELYILRVLEADLRALVEGGAR